MDNISVNNDPVHLNTDVCPRKAIETCCKFCNRINWHNRYRQQSLGLDKKNYDLDWD